jgi:hypothetical protein
LFAPKLLLNVILVWQHFMFCVFRPSVRPAAAAAVAIAAVCLNVV